MTIGEKIKKARQELKMTQSELAGEKITRNMLCQIELGIANPSIDTVRYLAERLSLPLSYLFSHDDDILFYKKKEKIGEIYERFEQKDFLRCVQIIESINADDDELAFLLATSYFNLARTALYGGSLQSALKYIELSENNCKKTRLNTDYFSSMLTMYRAIASNIQAPLLEFDPIEYDKGLDSIFDYELYKYLVQDYEHEYRDGGLTRHVKAKGLIKERRYSEAIQVLNEAVESGMEH